MKSPLTMRKVDSTSNATFAGDPFGDESEAEVKYRTLSWWQAAVTMIAETISLGILSLPSVLATIGIVGGLITLIDLALSRHTPVM